MTKFLLIAFFPIFILSGCPYIVPGDRSIDQRDRYIYLNNMKTLKNNYDIAIRSDFALAENMVEYIASRNAFICDDDQMNLAKEAMISKKYMGHSDKIFRVFRDDIKSGWSHYFLIKAVGKKIDIYIIRNTVYENNDRNSYYHFDWVSAIKNECEDRGIAYRVGK